MLLRGVAGNAIWHNVVGHSTARLVIQHQYPRGCDTVQHNGTENSGGCDIAQRNETEYRRSCDTAQRNETEYSRSCDTAYGH